MFGNIPTVSVHELKQIKKKKILLIDVRPREEYVIKHVPNSVNVEAKSLRKSHKDFLVEKAYIICASGGKSKRLVSSLTRKGYDVVWVQGGIQAFSHHYPVVSLQKFELENEKGKKKRGFF